MESTPVPIACFLVAILAVWTPGGSGEEAAAGGPDWPAILAPRTVELPPPSPAVVWVEDLDAAIARARAEDRPLFVTFRCLPCEQCSDFDRDVLEGGPGLDPLLGRFVTVRLTDARGIDLRLFPMEGYQDFDLSWWGWFLAPSGASYGVFGGRDHESDATRISVAALEATLRRVLEHHHHPDREAWGIDGEPPRLEGPARTPVDLPGFEPWARRGAPEAQEGCLHCHQVAEILRQPALDAGTFDKVRDLAVWPLPENVGLVLDRDDGLRVTAVEPGSPAALAGVRAGDRLAAAAGRRLFGQADLRAALHRGPRGAGAIELVWQREGEVRLADLPLAEGWRATELAWRMSVSQGNVGGAPGFWPLPVDADDRRKLALPQGALAVRPFYGREDRPARQAGIEPDRVVVAVDDERPDLDGRAFLTWFRLRYEPGDEVVYTLLDARGRLRRVPYPAE